MNDHFWECPHPKSPLFTPLQQIPQSPVATEVQMGSDEPHATPSIHEEIPATSANENVNEELKSQAATEEETEIPQPADPEIAILVVVMQLTDTPHPKPTDHFSKKQKFKADDFFHEHVFFRDYNSYDSARLRRKRFLNASQVNFYSSLIFNKDKVSTMSIFLTWTWNHCLASRQSSVCFMTHDCSTFVLT